ncbi:CPBP family intramembrane metalloprotease [Lutimaribacter sp. EGI FJ00015]|uniref:CPBP family intramembrane metalloprotease n=1 Tax=Lutimaribacter degradans TaxID=2945989 RepID=A0ACC6A072_9RHOB|nr:type II CAAX endopeptidase family protein [Lutimaribacter sp. EGI FJ00013]MCM2563406.1 CPBP family intramembrane metalloprotease [Lutimaribacter sp. EGI FJ00013]MCO0614515.1 CPBP family intramembrane metalloprotease [Lutimaribacter sp. EGI FJ00015]MCO0637188.1 CPBP family intramembrane metalloprotease [Lutimaribacter sp. EGI FJ00014]
MTYSPHRDFAAPARPSAQMHRLVLGVILIEGANSGLRWLLDAGLQALPFISAQAVWYGSTRAGLLIQLLSFAFLGLAVLVVAKRLHGRGFASLLGPPLHALRDMRLTLVAIFALFIVIDLLPPFWGDTAGAQLRNLPLWLLTLPLALAAVAIQTSAEELFYRGYIQQQIAARYRQTLIWMLTPNIMFALAHWQPGDFSVQGFQYVLWAFLFGLAASDLTARTGTLGAAMGFHLANNAYAFLLFGEVAGPDSGLALVLFPQGSLAAALSASGPFFSAPYLAELVGIALMWLVARAAIRR